MNEIVEGIIVSERAYSETSKIIDIITCEHGFISVLAKGAKSMKSKFRSNTGKLILANFNIVYKENKLSILREVDVINFYKNIKKDITKISYAAYILELAKQVVKQTGNNSVYENLISTLDKIDEGYDSLVLTNILELKYLYYLGVMPILDGCSKCGRASIITLSVDAGGYLCKDCRNNETIVSEKTIKLIKMFYYLDISKITKLSINDKVKEELNYFLSNYYDKYTGLYLKSKDFIKKVGKL
ncbi:MAG: DNA repair protein RecO [Bacilli bacterium]|nr:DNA repair protein RecO [Bacilli bacterium]